MPQQQPEPGLVPYGQYAPARMPGALRAAQALWCFMFATTMIVVVATAVFIVTQDTDAPVYVPVGLFVALSPIHLGFVCALLYGRGESWVRIVSLVDASILAVTGAVFHTVPAVMLLILTGPIVILLSRRSAGDWFRRPRVSG